MLTETLTVEPGLAPVAVIQVWSSEEVQVNEQTPLLEILMFWLAGLLPPAVAVKVREEGDLSRQALLLTVKLTGRVCGLLEALGSVMVMLEV